MSGDPRIGSYFVSNYPPFSAWTPEALPALDDVLDAPAPDDVPLGVYVHVPFCRKRCRFCYFKVYTEIPAATIRAYVDDLAVEAAARASRARLAGRRARFVYFGGGTPSFLSQDQLRQLFGAVRTSFAVTDDAEITFECEPGTLREDKLRTLRELGVTRLSIGVESFDPAVLELNGRAHGEAQIAPAFELARAVGFPRVNLDLIAGMVGETEAGWLAGIDRTIALGPDSVTIYQMEVPANTTIAKALRAGEGLGGELVDVATRRRWATEGFARLEAAGYRLTSGYTAVRGDVAQSFVYRDALWHGADLVPLGVSAFGHLGGVHVQNDKDLPGWTERIRAGQLTGQRGYALTAEQRLIRELVLQLKLGRVRAAPFRAKFGVDLRARFAAQWANLAGLAAWEGDEVVLTRDALMRVDELLPMFFLDVHGGQTASEAA